MTTRIEASVLVALRGARKRLERGWCQRHAAETMDGEPCAPQESRAARWALPDALYLDAPYEGGMVACRVLARIVSDDPYANPYGAVLFWANAKGRTRASLFRALDKAIAHAEKSLDLADLDAYGAGR